MEPTTPAADGSPNIDGIGARFGDVSVQAWFAQDEIVVRPGESTSLTLSVENVGDRTESYTVIPAGMTAAWTTVTRPNVTLFGGSRDVIEVTVRPPAIHSTSAGPTALAVRVIPQAAPDDAIVAETIATVDAFDDRRITVLQPLQRGRRRANFEFMVENHGNNLANCRLHLVDASERVDGSFDPPAVGVAPGASNLVRLKLRADRGFFRRTERQLDFEIEATEADHEPATGQATLLQPPTIPGTALWRALGVLAAIAALIWVWYGLVEPELQDAADRAVDERLDDFGDTSASTVPATSVATDDEDADDPTAPVVVEVGEPVAYRLTVDVGISQERSESLAVPPDSEFRLTDVVLQNPHGDLGTAQLLRNGDVLYEWDLGSMNTANEFQPRVSPIPFDPGANLVFAVSCDAAGQTSGTGCEVAVLVGGLLVPVSADE